MNAAEIIAQAKTAGAETQRLYPGEKGETWRAIKGYEQLIALTQWGYGRALALGMLDPRKTDPKTTTPPMFGVSERHIRRVETMAKQGKLEIVIFCADHSVSLETAEHMVLRPSTEMIEVAWLAASPEQRVEFMRRRGNGK